MFEVNRMEVFTTVDKAKRDELFRELRKSPLANERQVVKFSGVQPLLDDNGVQHHKIVQYRSFGKGGKVTVGFPQMRLQWQSTYSVAYPMEAQ